MTVGGANLILDFDSTIIQVEALDELAALALSSAPDGDAIAKEIARITDLGMEGKMPIDESLERRLQLLNASRREVEEIVHVLKEKISPSFVNHRAFFEENRERVFVISNGFKEYILPTIALLGLKAEHVFANDLIFDAAGKIVGYERENLLAQPGGKSRQLLALGLEGDVVMVGDGMTDFEMTNTGKVTTFIAYMGNVWRESVAQKADYVVRDFDEILALDLL